MKTVRYLVLLFPLPSTGCPSPCTGAGCEEEFSSALAGVIAGEDQLAGTTTSPLDTFLSIEGTIDEGPEWSLALGSGVLLAGSPTDGAVRRYPMTGGSALAPGDAEGLIMGEKDRDAFGGAVAIVRNDDGTSDLVVGAPRRDLNLTSRFEGTVYLYRGLGDGPTTELAAMDESLDVVRVAGARTVDAELGLDVGGGGFGTVVVPCPDMDGDGKGEWLASAPMQTVISEGVDDSGLPLRSAMPYGGKVALGMSSVLDGLGASETSIEALPHTWEVGAIGARAGNGLDCSSDLVDGDGVPDIVIGVPFADAADAVDGTNLRDAAGAIIVIRGGPNPETGPLDQINAMVITGQEDNQWLGWSVATGDLNGDGWAELVAGAPGRDNGDGNVVVWDGAHLNEDESISPRYRLRGEQDSGSSFGQTVAIVDVDGDGLLDLLVGAPQLNPSATGADSGFDSGALYVFLGSPDYVNWHSTMTAEEADLTFVEERAYLRTGSVVATGDYDGDGFGDVALSHRTAPR